MKPKTLISKITTRHNNLRGQSTVEMALVLIFVLLPIMVGILEFGRAFWYKQQVVNASRAAVRLAVVTSPLTALSSLTTKDPNALTNICSSCTFTLTLGANNPAKTGDAISVQVNKGFATIVPNFAMFNMIPNTITATTTMRYE